VCVINGSGCPGIDNDHSHIPDRYGLHMTSRNHCLKSCNFIRLGLTKPWEDTFCEQTKHDYIALDSNCKKCENVFLLEDSGLFGIC
jgi:hypothetical protein